MQWFAKYKKNQIKMKKLASRETPHSGQRDCVPPPWKKKITYHKLIWLILKSTRGISKIYGFQGCLGVLPHERISVYAPG